MGLSYLVYPANHTRFHHALGCMHLMQKQLLRFGVAISVEEENALYIAILLHDIGHGPFSHAMEKVLLKMYITRKSLALRRQ
jgi:HD superfamily phosphohydrolase